MGWSLLPHALGSGRSFTFMQEAHNATQVVAKWDKASETWTWPMIVRHAFTLLSGRDVALQDVYRLAQSHPRVLGKAHWKARIRQTIEGSRVYVRTGEGLWSFAALFTPEECAEFERLRRERWPLLGPRPKS